MHESVAAMAWDVAAMAWRRANGDGGDIAAMAWRRAKGLGVQDYVGRGVARILNLLLVISRELVGNTLLVIIKGIFHIVEI